MPDMTSVTIRDLTFLTESRRVLNIGQLDLPGKGISIVLGPNGAGKSVLMRVMHGILAPNSGRISFGPHKPRQAMVFQTPVLLRRTVAANIAFALQASGQPKDALGDLLARARLTDRAHQPARTLSGGEQQRLAMYRALATKPDILFMDEPSANLDPSATFDIEQCIQSVAEAGTKVIMVTHDIAQARRLAHDVSVLINGQIEDHGPAQRVLEHPATPLAQAFLDGRLTPAPKVHS